MKTIPTTKITARHRSRNVAIFMLFIGVARSSALQLSANVATVQLELRHAVLLRGLYRVFRSACSHANTRSVSEFAIFFPALR